METISSEPSSKDCWYGDVGDGYESYDQLIMSFALTGRVLHKLMHDDVDGGDGDSYELPQHNQDASQEIAGIIDLETQLSGRGGLSSRGENQKTYDCHEELKNI